MLISIFLNIKVWIGVAVQIHTMLACSAIWVKTKDSLDDKTDDVYSYMVKGRCTIVRYSSVANILFIENRENEYKNMHIYRS